MARRKTRIKTRYRRPLGKRVTSLAFWRNVAIIAVIVAVIVVVIWQWRAFSSWVKNVTYSTWRLAGFGLLPLLLAGTILIVTLSRKPKLILRRLSRFLGLFVILVAIWGVLGWLRLGGSVGSWIFGSHYIFGLLRVIGLAILGVILLASKDFFQLVENMLTALGNARKGFRITVLVLLATGILSALLFWQRAAILSLGNRFVDRVWGVFGWGMLLVVAALAITIVFLIRQKISAFYEMSKAQHWNRWAGGLVLLFALWGFLGLFSLGGDIGNFIAGNPPGATGGLLRVGGLFVLGLILMFPRLIPGLRRSPMDRAPVKYPIPQVKLGRKPAEKEPPQAGKVILPPAQEVARPEKEMPTSPATPPQPQELRQVAQEVWKKYGETADAVIEEGWRLPPVDILDKVAEVEFSEADNMNRARMIEEALGSYGVEAKVVQINVGPTVTQFGIEPGWDRKTKEVKEKDRDGNVRTRTEEVSRTRVKVERITSLANDLALALAAPSIRIEAPVPGKSVVGIEVPNTVFGVVSLRSVIESSGFQKLKARSCLALALGKGAGGEASAADLVRMPHLLIAGATGSGKTVCLNSVVCCLLLHNTPDDVRFIMIDPKRVELTLFNGIPHMAAPVIVDTEKAIGILRWLSQEMDKRYKRMAFSGVRNIEGYNKNRTGKDRMPYLVLVIDELADLMMAGFEEVEHTLCRLAQLARATGIHLVVATQRPSVDVVTGLIKANFPTRISFAVTSQVDSRTILDTVGAEKLLGRGDMLYMPTDAAKPRRLQGCFVSDTEAERLVYFWGKQKGEEAPSLNIEELVSSEALKKAAAPTDPLFEKARQLAEEHDSISASYLQRQLHIGYNRAAKLMEELEAEDNAANGSDSSQDINSDGGAEVPKG